MSWLREPVAMIGAITISTIAVAVVTFGILDSIAALSTPWAIGGAAAFALAWGGLLLTFCKLQPAQIGGHL